jgi:2-oxo-4-hydroxy-4-carboxy-5-ureidoimidazoline decarboxylase
MSVDEDAPVLVPIAEFDVMPAEAATACLRPCCASAVWVQQLTVGRPYGAMYSLAAASTAILADLTWSDVRQALEAHPRIGDRVAGHDREAEFSRGEQSGARSADEEIADALIDGNQAYEARFGHVFLICATGRSGRDILAALRQRLDNPTAAEREVVRAELAAIVRLRLARTFR